ncbi:MAG TPA: hypothetical protein VL098_09705 [Flavipsychrobacter sp.]|uniref:hypothetical protein n=1 Tax=Agriterribacter sp. TaxID=2821509 RepID=UPI002C2E10A8|nr:hypothetical protein [Agriterribacter sp.]HTN08243.1 hypothetical protein [Agriterribacter sp.]HTN46609.1 hypothetical protein [Flavipsychrobacter sp.]
MRSTNDEDEETKGYNIDIEFWGIAYIELPNLFRGIKIRKLVDSIPQKIDKFKSDFGYNVFQITTDDANYYVVAAGCKVGKNNWLNENRVLNPSLEYDEIVITL